MTVQRHKRVILTLRDTVTVYRHSNCLGHAIRRSAALENFCSTKVKP